MVGELSDENYHKYAENLLPYFLDDRTLFVVSSDFCHWGDNFEYQPILNGFKENEIYKSIEKLDRQGMELIEAQDYDGFKAYLKETENTICGRNPIQLLLAIIQLASKSHTIGTKFVKYDQSNAVKNKSDMSVSYASALITLSK